MQRLAAILIGLVLAAPVLADSGLRLLTQRDDLLGWEAVGRVDLGGGFCTGVLVAPDLVLTAAHCLYDGPRRRDPRQITFRAGLAGKTAVFDRAVRRAVVDPGYDPVTADGLVRLEHDAALLQLAEAIPAAAAAPFVPGLHVAPGAAVSVVSYAAGREDALAWQPECTVLQRGPLAYAFSCDVTFGASGAPVFESGSGRARIVAIVSGGGKDGDGQVAYGPRAGPALDRLLAALRAGKGVFPKEEFTIRRLPATGDDRDIGARFVRP
ncbi:protease YdgD [Rhodovulum iodosum]|uniref:Protease YdgD n=1 Tax=Rhodovulum iodosum TaxID=68291 RepID=A0ABV3XQ20_9RHOB|nr:trypsin-like peptidase domain-containing protein [Rhodovulum robiginosum]RSK31304.1 trypsin-like serine protease [Rhodovulum robiginosum]